MLYKRPKQRHSILVDLSPLIDVVFLLLIFFMVSTRFRDDNGMDLSLPKSESSRQAQGKYLTVYVDKNDVIRLNDEEMELEGLGDTIANRLPEFESKMVVLKVDESVNHGLVVSVMDAAKNAGAEGITFATLAKGGPDPVAP